MSARRDHNRHSGADRPAALEPAFTSGRRRARHRLGAGWAGSHHRRLDRADLKTSVARPLRDRRSAARCLLLTGAVAGALLFGWLTDRFGRRLIFNVTLGIYLLGVLLQRVRWNFWTFAAFRCITGLGIGGEYAAINSAIDELIPANCADGST